MTRPAPENVLQNVITYLCFRAKTLSQTRLMKLTYLANVYHAERYGSPLVETPFKHWHFGPFSEELNSEIEKLYGDGILRPKVCKTRAGHRAEVPIPNTKSTVVDLTDEAVMVLDEVIADWGDASTDEMVSFAKTSLPFVGTPFGKRIEFRRVDLVGEVARLRNTSRCDAATWLVENNEAVMDSLDRLRERVRTQGLP